MALVVVLASVSVPAAAQPKPVPAPSTSARAAVAAHSIEVMVLHATRTKARGSKPEIVGDIGALPELEQEPFSLYDRFELVQKARLPLKKGEPKSLELINGRVLRTALLEVVGSDTFRISASINKPGGKDFLPLLEVKTRPGKAVIVAGQSYKNGILVLVLRVVK